MSLYVRDLTGNEYPLQATITNEGELNGNQSVSATIYATKVNNAFINDITEMWELIDFEDVTHKIIYAKKKGEGNRLTVDVKAIPLFFDTFDTLRIYEEYNEHMTAQLAFTRIFADTGFNFVLVDSFDAVQWEGFGGGESRLETFKRAIERYKCEFRIVGNTVYLHKQIGRDTQFQYRYRLNASNITQENDASAMWTYAKGYGDYEEGGEENEGGGWQEANLIREYTSPLAQIIGIRHAPPIKDGRIKIPSEMDARLKTLVDESLKISVSADIHDLRRQGYPLAQPELGDRVFLIDERIGLDEEVRVVDMKITRNWKGEVLDLQLTFGSEGLAKRHQSNMQTAIKDITDVMAGRKKIPFSAYDAAVVNATNALKRMQTQLTIPENGGLMAIDKNDPNNVVLFNAAGVGISNDGGATFKTAMTGDGVVADVITSGHINSNNVTIGNNKILLNDEGMYVLKNGILGASLVEGNLTFNDQSNGQRIGRFAATVWSDNTTKGISMNMEKDRYISFGHYVDAATGYTPMLLLNPGSNMAGNVRGIHMNLPIRMNDDVWIGTRAIRFGLNNNHNHASIYRSSTNDLLITSYQSVGLAHITSGGVTNTKLSIHPDEVKVNVDMTLHGLNTRSYADLWMGAKTIRFGNDPFHNHATIHKTSGNDLVIGCYQSIGLSHIQSGGVYSTKFSVDSNTNNSWQDLDMHGWKIINSAEIQASSSLSYKTNLRDPRMRGLDVIKNLKVKEYLLQSDVDRGIYHNWQVGVISELSPEVATPDGKNINIYKLLSYNTDATKEIASNQERLSKRFDDVELVITMLSRELEELRGVSK